MRYSKLFTKTLRQPPADADTINHKLLVQAGYVRQVMAGVYTYTPLGLRVLNKISQVVREEMNAVGGQEVLMPILHPASLWKQTGGWDGIDVLFKLKSRTDKEYALSQSHEEVVTPLVREFLQKPSDMPLSVYHIQWKFRDELRSKSGIMRGREFLMKDMYSWHASSADFEIYYEEVKQAYLRVFDRLGLETLVTEASGGSFSEKISYEYEVLCEAGEANLLYCMACKFCVNADDLKTYKEGDECPRCNGAKLQSGLGAELGNIFDLGDKYTKAFDLKYIDTDGQRKYPVMGCYGIGISRTMGVLVEKFHDARGIVWPKGVAPFQAHFVSLNSPKHEALSAKDIYEKLIDAGIEVLWDDTDRSAGQKLADADLIGIPVRLVVSEKTGDMIEWKERGLDKTEILELDEVVGRISQ